MARLPTVDPDTAPEAVAKALRTLPPMSVIRTIAHADDVLVPWVGWAGALLSDTVVDPVLREIAILRVAALSPGAEYEWDQHVEIARECGTTAEQIEGCRDGRGLSGDDALVARFTELVVAGSTDPATWAQVDARFSPQEIIELLMVIGHYMMIARVCATFRVDPDPPIGTGLFEDLKNAS